MNKKKAKKKSKKIKYGWNKDKKYDPPLSLYPLKFEWVVELSLQKK